MSDDNKLWFEMGVRDSLTQTLQKGVELADKLGQGLDLATKKQAIYAENVAKLKDGYYKIDEAIEKINKSLGQTQDPAMKVKMQQTLQELEKLRSGLKAIEGDDKKMMESGSVAAHMRQNNFALMTKSVNRYTQAVQASERANRSAQSAEEKRVDQLRTRYNDLARIRERLSNAIIGAAPGVDTSKASSIAALIWREQMALARATKNGGVGYTTTNSDYRKLKQDAVDAAASVTRLTREQERLNRQLERDSAKRAAAALREQAAAAKAAAQANMDMVHAYDKVTEAGKRSNVMFEQMKSYMGTFVSFYGLKSLLNDVIQIGGEFEVQHIALQSILGDIEQANTMFNEMKQLAVVSPFNFKQLATYSKQVAAFGVPYEEMYDTTKRLADISAGLGVDMNRLILAFGQVRSAAVLRGQELRQFTEAGIPMVKALADEFTKLNGRVVTTGEVFELISKRAVPFEMVKKILWEMTDEGGRFYNMQYTLADTLAGKWSNLQDAWEIMLSEFARGESLSGKVLKTMVTWTTTLIESLNKIGPILIGLGGGYVFGKLLGRTLGFLGDMGNLGGLGNRFNSALDARILKAQKLNAIKIRERYIQGEINASEMQSLLIQNRNVNMWKTQLMLSGRMSKMHLLSLDYKKQENVQLLNQMVLMRQIDAKTAQLLFKGKTLEASFRMLRMTIKTAFGPLGWAMIAIDFIAAGLMSAWSSSNELSESINSAFDSIKQRYDDVSQFIKNTPIEVAIKTGDLEEMKNMIQMYKDQLRSNFPDTADYIISKAAGTDGDAYLTNPAAAEKMLRALKSELEVMNNLQEKAKTLAGAFATAADEADHWWTDSVKGNMQDFQNAINTFKNDVKGFSADDFEKMASVLEEMPDNFSELDENTQEWYRHSQEVGMVIKNMLEDGNTLEAISRYLGHNSNYRLFLRPSSNIATQDELMKWQMSFVNGYEVDYQKNAFVEQIAKMYGDIKEAVEQQNESLATESGQKLFHMLASEWMGDNEFSQEMKNFSNMYWDNLMSPEGKSITLPKILADQMKTLDADLAKIIASGAEMDEETKKKADRLYETAKTELLAKWEDGSGEMTSLMNRTFGDGVEIPFSVKSSLGEAQDVLIGWRKDLQAKLDKTPIQIKMGMNMEQIVEEIRKAYGTAETTINKLGPIAIHAGIKLDGLKDMDISQYQFTNPQLYNTLKALQDALASQEQMDAFAKANGLDFSDMKKDGSHKDGDKTDKALQALKKEYDLYKKFWSEYEKYTKMYGQEGALNKLKSDDEFKTVFGWKLSDLGDYANSVEEIQKRLKGGVGKSGDRKSFFDSMNADVQAQRRKEEAAAISSVNDALKTQLSILNEQYETYKKLYKLTGDSGGAASVAFGGKMMQSETYKDYLVEQMANAMGGDTDKARSALSMDKKTFNDTYGQNSEKLSVLYTAYQEHLVKLQKESLDLLLSTIEKNRTIEQQIEDENRNYQHQLSLLKEIRDPKMRSEAEKGLQKEHEKKSSKLQFEQFKENSNWVKIFDDLDRVSMRTIESMIEKVKTFSTVTGLSVEEIKALRDALEKLRNEQAERDPFTALAENVRLGNRRNKLLHSGAFSKDANGQWHGSYTFKDDASANRYGYKKGQTIKADDLQDDIRSNRSIASEAISKIGDKFKALQDVMQPVIDLFDTLGNEDLSNLFQMGNNALGAAGQAANGLNGLGLGSLGPYGAAAAAGLSIMGSLFAMHDKALEKEIQASKERQKLLENLTKNMETMLEHTFGGLYAAIASESDLKKLQEYRERYEGYIAALQRKESGELPDNVTVARNYIDNDTYNQIKEAQKSRSYYDAYKASLMVQRDELRHQMDSEAEKKDSDSGKIEDYNQQIKELGDQIEYLAEEMAKDLYSIDYKSWASGLAEALVSAWESGGNAADAYKKKISSILKEVGTKVITQKYLEPLLEKNMEEFMEYFKGNDGVLDEKGMDILARMYDDADKVAEMTNAYLDGLEKVANKHGETLKDTEESSGQTAIKSITEDQTNLLLSYINAMRADLSIHVQDLRRLMDQVLPDMSKSFGAQLAKLEEIRKEVARGADGVDKMNQKIDQLMTGVKKLSVKVYA